MPTAYFVSAVLLARLYMFRQSIANLRQQHQYLKPNKATYIYSNNTS